MLRGVCEDVGEEIGSAKRSGAQRNVVQYYYLYYGSIADLSIDAG